MQRDKWEFQYSSQAVKEAAEKKAKHHEERQEWWQKQQDEVIIQAQVKGITIDTSLATQYSGGSNVARGARLVVDESFQDKLNECYMKIREHRTKKEQYASWVEVLTPLNQTLALNSDDYLFFFSH